MNANRNFDKLWMEQNISNIRRDIRAYEHSRQRSDLTEENIAFLDMIVPSLQNDLRSAIAHYRAGNW